MTTRLPVAMDDIEFDLDSVAVTVSGFGDDQVEYAFGNNLNTLLSFSGTYHLRFSYLQDIVWPVRKIISSQTYARHTAQT